MENSADGARDVAQPNLSLVMAQVIAERSTPRRTIKGAESSAARQTLSRRLDPEMRCETPWPDSRMNARQ